MDPNLIPPPNTRKMYNFIHTPACARVKNQTGSDIKETYTYVLYALIHCVVCIAIKHVYHTLK